MFSFNRALKPIFWRKKQPKWKTKEYQHGIIRKCFSGGFTDQKRMIKQINIKRDL